jgi:RHS repeat-associated core domain
MAGISSKALSAGGNDNNCGCPNKKGFNGNEIQNKEFSDGSGLEVYDFNARTYDQQIGRFIQIDPLLEDSVQRPISPYHFSFNNPVRYNDPSGKCPICPLIPFAPAIGEAIVTGLAAIATYFVIEKNKDQLKENINNTINNANQNNQDNQLKSIQIDDKNKIPRDQLNPPTQPGNAPTFKKDGKPVEIHHEGQNPDGPFKEMHPDDHRGKGNDKINHPDKGKPSKIDRKQYNKDRRDYWKSQFPDVT